MADDDGYPNTGLPGHGLPDEDVFRNEAVRAAGRRYGEENWQAVHRGVRARQVAKWILALLVVAWLAQSCHWADLATLP